VDRGGSRSFANGEAGGCAGFAGVGLFTPIESDAVVFVALGISCGEGDVTKRDSKTLYLWAVSELLEEVQEVVGVLAGGIHADREGDVAVALGDLLESISELGVAGGGLREGEFGGGNLMVVVEEGGVVAVA
jgi:hypothetical protein